MIELIENKPKRLFVYGIIEQEGDGTLACIKAGISNSIGRVGMWDVYELITDKLVSQKGLTRGEE